MTVCNFCGADGAGELCETVRLMAQCTNCRVDIALKGEWIGHTTKIIKELCERYPRETVKAAFVEMRDFVNAVKESE